MLSKAEIPETPFEIAVMVRLDDESGAAGLVFHSDGADRQLRYRILEGLGDVLMLRGQYEPALHAFREAKALTADDSSARRAQIEGRLGELAFKRGDMRAARESIDAFNKMGANRSTISAATE